MMTCESICFPVTCLVGELQCSPVQCVKSTSVCNGVRDCENGRDEYCGNIIIYY